MTTILKWFIIVALSHSCLMGMNCGLRLRDGVLDGFSEFTTQTTVDLLASLFMPNPSP
jgi:hypothetical protein